MRITFGEGDRVDALYKGNTISTEQDGSLPAPFDLFMTAIGTCAGFYVSNFCRKRGIPTDGVLLEQRKIENPETRMVERIEIDIKLPEGFPDRYREAVIRSARACAVTKHLDRPPAIEVRAVASDAV